MDDPPPLSFRPVTPSDLPQLYRWSQAPHVRRWWDAPDAYDAFAEVVTPYLRDDSPTRPFLILHAGRPIGYIQVFSIRAIPLYRDAYALDEEAVGIDLYIGEAAYLHRRLGPHIIHRFLAEHVFTDPTITSCIIGPEPDNTAAIRAYEKAGFTYLKTVDFPTSGEQQYLMRLARTPLTPSPLSPARPE